MQKNIPVCDLRRAFTYNPLTGILRWAYKPRVNTESGAEAGCKMGGYRRVCLHGVSMQVHRVGWAMHYGKWPKDQIDHINMIRDDNRITNLREATNGENKWNTLAQSNNSHGSKGVAWDAQKQRWVARIMIHGKRIKIGRYRTREEASLAYAGAAEKLVGEFARW